MKMKKNTLLAVLLAAVVALPAMLVQAAEEYRIDPAHSFIHFRVSHLGIAWVQGRFNRFEGEFVFDEQTPANSRVTVTIDTASVDSNHAERDRHLRSDDFLDVRRFPNATFVATGFDDQGDDRGVLTGDLTLHGVTRPVSIDVQHIGHGPDPWGGYRRGFEGRTRFALADFGITYDLGPAAREVELTLSIEGIRK
jgi:polyisoprenoid-binding protein YceI